MLMFSFFISSMRKLNIFLANFLNLISLISVNSLMWRSSSSEKKFIRFIKLIRLIKISSIIILITLRIQLVNTVICICIIFCTTCKNQWIIHWTLFCCIKLILFIHIPLIFRNLVRIKLVQSKRIMTQRPSYLLTTILKTSVNKLVSLFNKNFGRRILCLV
jgi:hypothetical protein